VPDNAAIAKLAADHFTARGFQHYAFYVCSGGPSEHARYRAFADALAARDLTLHALDWANHPRRGKPTELARLKWLRRSIQTLPKPLAIFGEFDDRAAEILQACEMAQIPVPEQVAVMGVDNDVLRCDFAPVPLSSIDDDQHQQGYSAAALLQRMLAGEKPPSRPLLVPPREIITRQSSDILAVEHPVVAGALRAIWEHYTEPIRASDIAQMMPMSSRRLHDAFCKHIGHSISEELARKRVEYVKGMLTTTDQKLQAIADVSGFSSPDNLAKVFARLTGTSPSRYRR